jgi:hypothetical protein
MGQTTASNVPEPRWLGDVIREQNAHRLVQIEAEETLEVKTKFPGLERIVGPTITRMADILRGKVFFDTLNDADAELLATSHTGPLLLSVKDLSEDALRILQKHDGTVTIEGVEFFHYINEKDLPPDGTPTDLEQVKAEVQRQKRNPTFKSSVHTDVSKKALELLEKSSLVKQVVAGYITKDYAGSIAAHRVYQNFEVLAA